MSDIPYKMHYLHNIMRLEVSKKSLAADSIIALSAVNTSYSRRVTRYQGLMYTLHIISSKQTGRHE